MSAVVEAWGELARERVEPSAVSVVKGSRSTKRTIYRLAGVGERGTDVIAKRCLKTTARLERLVYEQVLPRLPLTAPHYYGLVQEEGEYDWLFLEDVGDERFSPLLAEHRRLAAQWLGTLHVEALRLGVAASVPDRQPCSYLERLRESRAAIGESLLASGLDSQDRQMIESVARQCEAIARSWSRVDELCEGMPRTLVHADFRPKNVRVRAGALAIDLYPLDWEMAGWGVAAVDLAPSRSSGHAVDLDVYGSLVRKLWPHLDERAVQEMEQVGRLLRVLDAVAWASAILNRHPEKALNWLRCYETNLSEAIRSLG